MCCAIEEVLSVYVKLDAEFLRMTDDECRLSYPDTHQLLESICDRLSGATNAVTVCVNCIDYK